MNSITKFVNPAKVGKKFGSIVDLNDVRYPCPADLVGRFMKGSAYNVTLEQATWDGKDVQIIRGVEAVAAETPKPNGRHTGLTEAELRFVSNVVGQALVAKAITTPIEISVWAKAATATLKELG